MRCEVAVLIGYLLPDSGPLDEKISMLSNLVKIDAIESIADSFFKISGSNDPEIFEPVIAVLDRLCNDVETKTFKTNKITIQINDHDMSSLSTSNQTVVHVTGNAMYFFATLKNLKGAQCSLSKSSIVDIETERNSVQLFVRENEKSGFIVNHELWKVNSVEIILAHRSDVELFNRLRESTHEKYSLNNKSSITSPLRFDNYMVDEENQNQKTEEERIEIIENFVRSSPQIDKTVQLSDEQFEPAINNLSKKLQLASEEIAKNDDNHSDERLPQKSASDRNSQEVLETPSIKKPERSKQSKKQKIMQGETNDVKSTKAYLKSADINVNSPTRNGRQESEINKGPEVEEHELNKQPQSAPRNSTVVMDLFKKIAASAKKSSPQAKVIPRSRIQSSETKTAKQPAKKSSAKKKQNKKLSYPKGPNLEAKNEEPEFDEEIWDDSVFDFNTQPSGSPKVVSQKEPQNLVKSEKRRTQNAQKSPSTNEKEPVSCSRLSINKAGSRATQKLESQKSMNQDSDQVEEEDLTKLSSDFDDYLQEKTFDTTTFTSPILSSIKPSEKSNHLELKSIETVQLSVPRKRRFESESPISKAKISSSSCSNFNNFNGSDLIASPRLKFARHELNPKNNEFVKGKKLFRDAIIDKDL